MSRRNPFVGPRSLERDDGIFGRGREIRRLVNTLYAERVVLLHSPSGAGKTSLVQAGLIPTLETEGFEVLPPMRVSQQISTQLPADSERLAQANPYLLSLYLSLESAFVRADATPAEVDELPDVPSSVITKISRQTPPLAPDELLEYDHFEEYLKARWSREYTRRDQVLIFDQFEEILTVNPYDRDGKHHFFRELGHALRDRDIYALFVARDDYVAGLEQYARPVPSRLRVHFRLDLLDPKSAMEAIQETAATEEVTFEEAAAHKLVDDLRQVQVMTPEGVLETQPGPFVEPVQLQVACRSLWSELEEKGGLDDDLINVADLTETRDVSEALGLYYADSVADVAKRTGVSERRLRRWINDRLITRQGVRDQILLEPVKSAGMETRALLELRELHVLRIERRHGASWFELSHDRLVQPVRHDNELWFEANLSTLQLQAALWGRQGRPEALLLRDEVLEEAETWAAAHPDEMGEAEERFLQESRRLRDAALEAQRERDMAEQQREMARQQRELEQQRRANRRLVAVLGLLALALILAAVLAVVASSNAERAGAEATAAANARATAEAGEVVADKAREAAVNALATAEADRALAQTAEANAESARATAVAERAIAVSERATAQAAQVAADEARATAEAALEQARTNARLAESRRLAFASESLLESNRPLSLLLAGQALRVFPGQDALDAANRALEGTEQEYLNEAEPAPGGIEALLFSANGQLLVNVAGETNGSRLELWSTSSDDLLWRSELYSVRVPPVLAPDNRLLALATVDGRVLIWKLELGRALDTPEGGGGSPTSLPEDAVQLVGQIRFLGGTVTALAWLDSSTSATRQLALGDAVGQLWLAEVATTAESDPPKTSEATETAALDVALPAAVPIFELQLANAPTDTIRLGDPTDLISDQAVTGFRLSPDGSHLAAGGANGGLSALRLVDGIPQDLFSIDGEIGGAPITQLIFVPDSNDLLTGAADGRLQLWSLGGGTRQQSGIELIETLGQHEGSITGLAISADSILVASSSEDGTARLWDLGSASELARFQARSGSMNTVSFSADGSRLVMADDGGNVLVRDTLTNRLLNDLAAHDGPVRLARFSPFDPLLLASGGSDGALRLWQLSGDQTSALTLAGHVAEMFGLAFSPTQDGPELASSDVDGVLRLWDLSLFLRSGDTATAEIDSLSYDGEFLGRVSWHPDGSLLSFSGQSGQIHVWSISEGQFMAEVAVLNPAGSAVFEPTFSPDGRWLAAGDFGGQIMIWAVEQLRQGEEEPAARINVGEAGAEVFTLAFNRDSSLLAAAITDPTEERGRVLLWPLPAILSWEVATTMPEPAGIIELGFFLALVFDPGSDRLVTGDQSGVVSVWDVAPAQLAATGPLQLWSQAVHADLVSDLDVDAGGNWLATASRDGTATLWRINPPSTTGGAAPLTQDRSIADGQELLAVAFSPGGRFLAIGRADGNIRLELVDSVDQLLSQACRAAGRNMRYDEWQRYADVDRDTPYEPVCVDLALPDGLGAFLIRDGAALARNGQPETGLQFVRQAIALDPTGVANLADYDGAAILDDPAGFVNRQWALGLVEAAQKAATAGRLDEALALLDQALALDRAALAELDPAIAADPVAYLSRLAVPALLAQGRALAQAGNINGAVALFSQALAADPDQVAAADPALAADPQDAAVQLALSTLINTGVDLTPYSRPIRLDQTVSGAVQAFGGQVWRFDGQAGLLVGIEQLEAESSGLDSYLYLLGPDSTLLAENDDSEDSRNSRLGLRLPTDGTYFILARGYQASAGAYQLRLATGASLSAEELVRAGILAAEVGDAAQAADLFREAMASDPAAVDESIQRDPEGYAARLAVSRVLFDETRPAAAAYELATSLALDSDDAYAAYFVCFSALADGLGALAADACRLAESLQQPIDLGERREGFVEGYGGQAWRFTGRAGQSIVVTMRSETLDTYLTLVGPEGTVVDFNDDFEGRDSRLELVLARDGDYVILAHGFESSSGPYVLTLAAGPQ